MKVETKGKLAAAAIFLFALSIWPQGAPGQTSPDNLPSTFNSQPVNAAEAAANDNSGLAALPAPKRDAVGANERVIVVDPEKERKEREKMHHDPTFDGSGLFADIKGIPSATPGARVDPVPSASPKATVRSSEKPNVSPSPSATPRGHSQAAPVAGPVPNAPKNQGASPVATATVSPHN
jgi:hypothetical protein